MLFLRSLLVLAALVLVAAIVWAAFSAPFWASFAYITANPWGVVTLVDLYSGFLAASLVIWVVEPQKPVALALILLMLALGNIVTLVWVAWRGAGQIQGRISARRG
jgi:hypothetical protein